VTPQAGGIRDRFRAQMIQEIKDLALRQLAEGGPQALSVNAIARSSACPGRRSTVTSPAGTRCSPS
jgi:hypothetical protein